MFPYQKLREANPDSQVEGGVSVQFNVRQPGHVFAGDQEIESIDLKSLPGGSTVFGGVHLVTTE